VSIFGGNPEEEDHTENSRLDGITIITCIIKKCSETVWVGFDWIALAYGKDK
jgi:hypothetical protein